MSTSPQDLPSPPPQPPHELPSYASEIAASHEEQPHDDSQPESPSQPSQDPHPPFDPVFTLLTNTTTNATTHPRVHYIFSDDDPSLLSSAIADDPDRRALLIDLLPSQPSASASRTPAWRVSWAASLSPDFALTSSRIAEHENGSSGVDVMLRLEGVEREPVDLKRVPGGGEEEGSDEEGGSRGIDKGDMEDKEALVEDFRRRMGVLQKVVDEAAKREAVMAPYREQEEHNEEEADEDDDNEEAVTSGPRVDEDTKQA
ncbi:hypothetical protein LIA77_00970 [Sarocladium implicatum]|nr:hypothetical protein LIA77_00970 [Sarocladium implicatum]